jgi:hypothetical protein
MIGTGTNVANIGTGASNAAAGASIAQGNVYGNMINTLGNAAYLYQAGKGGPSGVPTSGDGMTPSLGGGYTPSGSNYLTS